MSEVRRRRGTAARLSGRRGEILAALWLMAKGYRILGFRLRLPQGEIDLLAVRGRVLVAVEVKARTSIEAALGPTKAIPTSSHNAASERRSDRKP